MKNKYSLSFIFCLLFSFAGISSFGTQRTIGVSGLMFSPDSILAIVGDTINFNITSFHSAVEVSQATWNANGNTSNGGFNVPTGGGSVVLTSSKTYYYVCGIHFASGMKGRIFAVFTAVENPPAVSAAYLQVLPNPVSSSATIKWNLPAGKENQLKIFDITGRCIYERANISPMQYLDLSVFRQGIYFIHLQSDDLMLERRFVISK